MPIDLKDTYSLIRATELIKPAASLLTDTFFSNIPATSPTSRIVVEYRKSGRRLAPYIVKGSQGVGIAREGSTVSIYEPPMLAPYRTLTADDIRQRGFGESCYSDRYASERASQLQARDLVDLQNSIINRKNHTAAEILTKGGYVIEGLADDGSTVRTDTIAFDWDGKIGISSAWSNPGALIYHDIEAASDFVQERAGQVPKIMMCGGNIAKYLFNNDNILKHLNVPSRDNLSLFNFNPQIVSNQVQRIGYIQALGLEIYSYKETYKNDNGETVPFLDPDAVIIGIGGLGNQLHGAVDLVNDNGEFETFISPYIPRYIADKRNNQMTVTLYSRFIMAPDTVDSWAYINAKGV